MCSLSSLVNVVAFALILLAFLATGIGFLSPNWVDLSNSGLALPPYGIHEIGTSDSVPVKNLLEKAGRVRLLVSQGLMARCYLEVVKMVPDSESKKMCQWFWHNDFEMEHSIPDWHKASQAIFVVGYVVITAALLLAIIHLCCRCCRKQFSLSTVVGGLVIVATLLLAGSVAIYGTFEYRTHNVQLSRETDVDDPLRRSGHFDWGCYVVAAGLLSAIVSAVLFLCDGCRSGQQDGQQYQLDGFETSRMM